MRTGLNKRVYNLFRLYIIIDVALCNWYVVWYCDIVSLLFNNKIIKLNLNELKARLLFYGEKQRICVLCLIIMHFKTVSTSVSTQGTAFIFFIPEKLTFFADAWI